jgi:quinohemoprotein ethanol dehydrogenase
VTWASKIDLTTGRPVEVAGARFPGGKTFDLWPSYTGAHSWMPSAFSPQSGLVYIPAITSGARYGDSGIDLKHWQLGTGISPRLAVNADPALSEKEQNSSALVAWNPVTQKQAWRVPTAGGWNGGILATGGNLVFQGQLNGRLSAYGAASGKELWHFDAQAGILSAPISYRAGGKQYISVVVGIGTSVSYDTRALGGVTMDYRTQPRRVLIFAIGGDKTLPKAEKFVITPLPDPSYRPDAALAAKGADIYNQSCVLCHGVNVVAGGTAPDLRASPVPQSPETFAAIVHGGGLVASGMPQFPELSSPDLAALRQHLRASAADLRAAKR